MVETVQRGHLLPRASESDRFALDGHKVRDVREAVARSPGRKVGDPTGRRSRAAWDGDALPVTLGNESAVRNASPMVALAPNVDARPRVEVGRVAVLEAVVELLLVTQREMDRCATEVC